MKPILYSFRRCPYAMRARMAIDAAGIEVEHREVVLSRKPAAMLDASPKGTVPVLVLPDGCVLDESLDIMDWALARHDPEGWRHAGARDRADAFLNRFKPALDRYKYASRYRPGAARGDVDAEQGEIALRALIDFAAPLDGQAFLSGAAPGYLDIATFPFVRQFAAVEPERWAEAAPAAVQRWLQTLVGSGRFHRIMAKRPEWDGDAATPDNTAG